MNGHFQLRYELQAVVVNEYMRTHHYDNYNGGDDNNFTDKRRRYYSIEEQNQIKNVYESFDDKANAIEFLQLVYGFDKLNERKIKRWMKSANKPMGRPISPEFEAEVLDEFKGLLPHTELSRDNLRMCGYKVLNREYINTDSGAMEKKWLKDTRTRNLKFTDRWITGMLKRNESSTPVATAAVEGMV